MRKIAVLLLASALLYGTGAAWHTFRMTPAIDLAKLFASSGATLLESTVEGWCELLEPVDSVQEAGRLLEKVVQGMGLTGPIRLHNEATGEGPQRVAFFEARCDVVLPSGYMQARIQQTMFGQASQTYLIMTLTHQGESPNLSEQRRLLALGAEAVGATVQRSTQLIGVIEGSLTPEQGAIIVARIMGGADAEMNDLYQQGGLLSVSGYSPLLEENTLGIGGRVNINLAMRYDPESDKTWIILGSPCIWESI